MSYTITTSVGVSGSGVPTVSKTKSHTVENPQSFEVSVGIGVTDMLVNLAIDISQLLFLLIHTDQDLSMETNNSAAPQETFALDANNPLYWSKDAGVAVGSLFAGDVTKLYFTNASGVAANVVIILGLDATP